jgi:N-dimethylarginine dimethylaminohydrolase
MTPSLNRYVVVGNRSPVAIAYSFLTGGDGGDWSYIKYLQTRIDARKRLCELVAGEGFTVKMHHDSWPRNLWVAHKGMMYNVENHGVHANGGAVIAGDNYVYSTAAFSGYSDGPTHQETMDELRKLYEVDHCYLLPPFRRGGLHQDIDFDILPIDQRGVHLVDESYLKWARESHPGLFTSVQDDLGVRIVPVPDSNNRLPLNALVLESNDDELILFTARGGGLQAVLDREGIEARVIETPFESNIDIGGSVRCASNVVIL